MNDLWEKLLAVELVPGGARSTQELAVGPHRPCRRGGSDSGEMSTYSHSSSDRSQSLMTGSVVQLTCWVWLRSGPERLTQ